ncbi:MAG: hypothetical protein ACM34J_11480, partial [Ignavibacteria bacterium]
PDKVKEGLNIIPIEKIEDAIPHLFNENIKSEKQQSRKRSVNSRQSKEKGKTVGRKHLHRK